VGVPLIRVVDLTKEYRNGDTVVRALRGITLEIYEGEFVAVMGPSGSGKSTLMSLFGLLDRPTSGCHLLDGREVAGLDEDTAARLRNRAIGFVFQTFNLLARSTALENVELPLAYAGVAKKECRRRATEALRRVGLDDRMNHWPRQLSGGEQQRVAMARALANRPQILLADEPTGNLDARTAGGVFQALLDLVRSEGLAGLVATHNLELAARMDRALVLHEGKLLDAGKLGARPPA
jgi:ABC-type lipoprotein export system ATPase subunit